MAATPSKPRAKGPDPVDVEVGKRIRAHRLWRGLSQGALGRALGMTFQQIQKYEKGTNRVSASRIVEIAKVFGVPPANLFPDHTASARHGHEDMIGTFAGFIQNSEARELNMAFARVSKPAVRKAIVALVHAIAERSA